MKLTPRDAGRASIQISAEGESAPVAADRFMVSDPDVTVQILNRGGAWWESRLTEGRRYSGDSYKGAGEAE